jgi:hypothetical protein
VSLKEYQEATQRAPKGSDMFEYLREHKYGSRDSGKACLLRCPGSNNFIEATREQYDDAINEFERLCTIGLALGEKATPLQRIGIEMLLGWDYEHYAKDHLAPRDDR